MSGAASGDDDAVRAEIFRSVLRFIAAVVLHNQEVSQRVGLRGSDSQFVSLLNLHGPLTPGRLAELSGLTTGTVTGVVDRLESAGYVRRERDAGDRRKVLVTLVPEKMAGLAEHYRAHGETLDAALRSRDASDLRVIASFLAELVDPAAATGTADPASPDPGRRG